jgi:hypothetical protein
MSWLAILRTRISLVLPATSNPTQRVVFMEWLQLCDKAAEEQAARIAVLKAALADVKAGFELELPGQWPSRFDKLLEPEDP